MIVIYGAEWCKHCKQAKDVATQYSLAFQYKDVDIGTNKADLKAALPTVQTIPQIWWHDRHIGGMDDFIREIQSTIGDYGQSTY